jgi:putative ABC transport system substrate-binding protein
MRRSSTPTQPGSRANFHKQLRDLVSLKAHTPAALSLDGTGLADAFLQVGVYTGSILKGAKPADLPVLQSTKFEFVVNIKTAKALGITFPLSLLDRADEVIK